MHFVLLYIFASSVVLVFVFVCSPLPPFSGTPTPPRIPFPLQHPPTPLQAPLSGPLPPSLSANPPSQGLHPLPNYYCLHESPSAPHSPPSPPSPPLFPQWGIAL